MFISANLYIKGSIKWKCPLVEDVVRRGWRGLHFLRTKYMSRSFTFYCMKTA